MQTFGKFLAGVCAVLFIITGVLALLFFNVERKAFSSATYKQAFEEENLYERMPQVLAIALSTSIAEKERASAFLKLLTTDQWRTTISSILPPEELKTLTNEMLDSTFDYLNGKTDSIVISLLPFKNQMTTSGGMEAIKQILRAQPNCTPEQLMQMAVQAFTGGDLILCNPPEEALGLVTPLIETQLQIIAAAFPDEITLISVNSGDSSADPRSKLNKIRLAMQITPFFPLVFLSGIMIFGVRSLVGWLRWWGWPFMITGGFSILIGLLGSPILGWSLQRVIENQGAVFIPLVLSTIIAETASAVAHQMLKPVAIEGFILVMIGLMITIEVLLVKREKDQILQRLDAGANTYQK